MCVCASFRLDISALAADVWPERLEYVCASKHACECVLSCGCVRGCKYCGEALHVSAEMQRYSARWTCARVFLALTAKEP